MNVGDIVRPVVSLAGLKSTQLYRVAHVERAAFGLTLAYLLDSSGALLAPIDNAHLVLEVVKTSTMRPTVAVLN